MRLKTGDTERDLTSSQFCNVTSRCRYFARENMADVRASEKIVREIEKTSESIRKKHRALKTGRIEEDMALDRHFKLIIKPLQQIVDSPVRAIKRQSRDDNAASKRERKEVKEEEKEGEKASETFERLRVNPMIDRMIVYSR